MNKAAYDFPPPAIPIAPVLSGEAAKWTKKQRKFSSILSASSVLHVSSGRAAIALALEHAGVGVDDEVLVPAYHCESMVSPIRWRKSKPIFFQINPDTTIDLEDIERRISANTKAIIVTHYFGFLQHLGELRNLCDRNNILLLEDYAHAFFSRHLNEAVAATGDYAIASSMKFFPVYDGGVLASNRRDLCDITLSTAPLTFQLKAALNTVETAVSYGRFGTFGFILGALLRVKEAVWKTLKRVSNDQRAKINGPESSEGGYGLDENWIHMKISRASLSIMQRTCIERICTNRCENFRYLLKELSDFPGIKPLFDSLPQGIIPLVFPVYFESPEIHFQRLKRLGVPIWRFGEYLDEQVKEEEYPVTTMLSRHIFQFPCHQELTRAELEWMTNTIKTTLAYSLPD